jgi:hypothetical protein
VGGSGGGVERAAAMRWRGAGENRRAVELQRRGPDRRASGPAAGEVRAARLPDHGVRAGDGRWEDVARGAEGRWACPGGSARGENALGQPPGKS